MAENEADWVGLSEAARIVGVSHATIRTWAGETFRGNSLIIRIRQTAIGTLYNRADLVRKAEKRKGDGDP
jgi:hypothetical protein